MNRFPAFAMLLMGLAAATPAWAQEADPHLPPAFVKQMVDGINARDLKALKAIISPESLKCMTDENEDYYRWQLWKDGSKPYSITPGFQLKAEKPVDVTRAEESIATSSFKPLAHWPVQPDTGFYVTYTTAPMSVMERLFEATEKNGQALLVLDCPTPFGLEKYQEKRKALEAQDKKLKKLWKTLGPADRKKLSGLAKGGHKLDGMKIAEQKYHLDTTESLAFMDMIEYADTPQ